MAKDKAVKEELAAAIDASAMQDAAATTTADGVKKKKHIFTDPKAVKIKGFFDSFVSSMNNKAYLGKVEKVKELDLKSGGKEYKGEAAIPLANLRIVTGFSSKLKKYETNDTKHAEAVAVLKDFITTNDTLEKQKANSNLILRKLLNVYTDKSKGGARREGLVKEISMTDLNF